MTTPTAEQNDFIEVIQLIETARQRVNYSVNVELIDLYWKVGEYVSRKIANDEWGKNTVQALSSYIQLRQPNIRGFSPQNIWRMRQFFEAYCSSEPKLSTLLRELPWSSNLHILTRAKLPEEREFYLRMATLVFIWKPWIVTTASRMKNLPLVFYYVLAKMMKSLSMRSVAPYHPL